MKEKDYITIDCMEGKDGNISVVFCGAPFRLEKDGTKRYIDPNFGAWLLEEIYRKNNLFCIKKGLFHKEWFCPSCQTKLNSNNTIQNQVEYKLEYKEYPSFTIQITLPSVICPECKKINAIDINGTLEYRVNEVIIQAFKSKNILP